MKLKHGLTALSLLVLLLIVGAAPAAANEKMSTTKTKCDLTFSLTEWAAVYEHATGKGKITCDNGQKANVMVTSKGVGLTAGKYRIDGKGEFSQVHDIADLFGGYLAAEGDAGLVKAAGTAVVTKGDVSLAIAGHGEGWNVGVSLGQFKLNKTK